MVATGPRDGALEGTLLLLPTYSVGGSYIFSGKPLENKD
jgi:hypothetical protein